MNDEDVQVEVYTNGSTNPEVRVIHKPTGRYAVCNETRSQLQNLSTAMEKLRKEVEPAPTCLHDSQRIYKVVGDGCHLMCLECGEKFGRIEGTDNKTTIQQAMVLLRNQVRTLSQRPK